MEDKPMRRHWTLAVFTACCMAFLALHCSQQAPDTRAADEAAIRDVNPAWFKAYNAGDAGSVIALYAEDAVLSAPGATAARGHNAIRELLAKEIAASTAAGMTLNAGTASDVGVSGDLGWEWGTFTVTDKSGATVDTGKYLTVLGRKSGKWLIIRDIWNSDAPMRASVAK